jgi:oligosaccharide translocation protein RFT1
MRIHTHILIPIHGTGYLGQYLSPAISKWQPSPRHPHGKGCPRRLHAHARSSRSSSSSSSSNWKLIKQNGQAEGGSYFDSNLTKLGWALTKQSLVKQVLTEGDKFVVTRFGKSDQDLASYAVALNYGSLVARIIFQPLEESSRLYFSSFTTTTGSRLRSLDSISIHLSNVLTLYSHFSLILIFLVPPYISPLLNLLLGSTNWGGQDSNSSVSSTLKSYVYSLPFLAFNGVLEAGLQSFADQIWLKRYSRWMVICTIGFLATFVWYNNHDADGSSGSSDTSTTASKGLILGNCVNMGMRIGFSSLFLFNYFVREFGLVEKEELAKDKEGDIIDDDDDEGDYERKKRMMKMFWQRLKFSNWRPSFSTFMGFFFGGQLCKYTEKRWLSSSRGGRGKVLKSLGIHFGTGIIVGLGCLTIT